MLHFIRFTNVIEVNRRGYLEGEHEHDRYHCVVWNYYVSKDSSTCCWNRVFVISNNLNRVIGSRNLLGRNIVIRGTLWADTKDSIKTGVSFLSHFNGMNFTLNENRILSVRNENDAHSVWRDDFWRKIVDFSWWERRNGWYGVSPWFISVITVLLHGLTLYSSSSTHCSWRFYCIGAVKRLRTFDWARWAGAGKRSGRSRWE